MNLKIFLQNKEKKLLLNLFLVWFSSLLLITLAFYQKDNYKIINSEKYGKWQALTTNKVKINDFQEVGTMHMLGNSEVGIVCSFDKNMFTLSEPKLFEGRYPKNEREVIVEANVLNSLGKPYQCYQEISLKIEEDIHHFVVVGIMQPFQKQWMGTKTIQCPTIITTNLSCNNSLYFVYDEKLTERNINQYEFDQINIYAYPQFVLSKEPIIKKIIPHIILSMIILSFTFVVIGIPFCNVFFNPFEISLHRVIQEVKNIWIKSIIFGLRRM